MARCEAPGVGAAPVRLSDATAVCKPDKKPAGARRVITSGPSTNHPQPMARVEARRAPGHQRRVAETSTPGVSRQIAGPAKSNQSEPVSVGAKIDQLKKKLGMNSLQGAELEKAVEDKIEELTSKDRLGLNIVTPLDKLPGTIDAHIRGMKPTDPDFDDWMTLKNVVELKSLILPGVEGNIKEMKRILGVSDLNGPALERTIEKKIFDLAGELGLKLSSSLGDIPGKLDKHIVQLETEGADSEVIQKWNTLKLAVDLRLQLPLKKVLSEEIAAAKPQAKKFIDTLITSAAPSEVRAGQARVIATGLRDHSNNMAKLHGGKSQDYQLAIPLNEDKHAKLCDSLKDQAAKGLITQADVDLITKATSPEKESVAANP